MILKNDQKGSERKSIHYEIQWEDSIVLEAQPSQPTLLKFVNWLADKRAQKGNVSVGKRYKAVVKAFLLCIGKKDILVEAITKKEVGTFIENYLAQGKAESTLNTDLHALNTIYNYARENGITSKLSPFLGSWENLKKTQKVAMPLTMEQLRTLRTLDLSKSARLAFARDLFLVSFYCEGLTFKELSSLERSPDFPHMLFYTDSFQGSTKVIEEDGEIARILAKYGNGKKVFPLTQNTNSKAGTSEKGKIKAITKILRMDLIELGELAGFDFKLTISHAKDTVKSLTTRRLLEEAVVGKPMALCVPDQNVQLKQTSFLVGFSQSEINLIQDMELEKGSDMELARDIFLLAAYMKKVSFFEFASMEWSSSRRVRTCVRDKKTGKIKYYQVPEEAKNILEKYSVSESEGEYILPLYNKKIAMAKSVQLRRISSRINQALETISQNLPISHRLLLKEVMPNPDGKAPR